jgi:predicted ferric reductase
MTTTTKAAAPHWMDWAVGLVVLGVALGAVASWASAGLLSVNLFSSTQWSWFIVRAAGLTGFLLLAASMVWGVFISSHLVKNWVPGTVSMLMHATTSWLAVVLSLAHMGLLLFDNYYTYTLSNLLIPFTGPYRPFAVGLGIISFWLILAITISFSMRKLMSRRAWLWLHYTSYAAFGLVAVHALMAGTDATRPAMIAILGGSGILIASMLAMRISQSWAQKQLKDA